MRHVLIAAASLALVAACSSTTESSESGPCAERQGSYVARYTARGGNCGDGTERILNIASQPPAGPQAGCDGPGITYSADNCEVTYESTCPEDGIVQGGKVRITGKSKWNRDATQGTATEEWFVSDARGQTICSGTYDVTITRQ